MTREEREKALEVWYDITFDDKRFDEARKISIEALKTELTEDTISRQAVLEKAIYTETEEGWSGRTVDVNDIESLPPVIPSRPTGRWIKHENNAAGICMRVSWECSECHVWLGCEYFVRRSYCPNCGAKMESEVEQ